MTSVDRIQGLSGSLAIKVPCRVATTANISLSAEQTIDGVAVVDGDRVLVKDQTDTTENGIYECSTGSWSRTADFDGANDVVNGTLVPVVEGTVAAAYLFQVSGTEPIVPGTTAITLSNVLTTALPTAFMLTLLDDANAAAARTTLGVAIGSDVQGYDVDTTKNDVANTFTATQTLGAGAVLVFEGTTADDFETTLTAGDPTADRTVTLPNATTTLAGLAVEQSFTAQQTFKEIKETVFEITDGAAFEIDPANGTMQKIALGADRTPKATNFESGQSVLLKISDGATRVITWTDGTLNPTWVGGVAPTLATTGYTWVVLWKDADGMYASHIGNTA